MGVANVATSGFDLRNLRRARRYWTRSRVEVAFLDEDRDMFEGVDLGSRQISETARFQLDDGFDFAGRSRCPGVAARRGLKRGSGRERRRFGVTHQGSATNLFRQLGHLRGSIVKASRVSRTWRSRQSRIQV